MSKVKGNEGKHQNLVNLLYKAYSSIGIECEKNVEYDRGEMDLYIPKQELYIPDRLYIECKCNQGHENKAVAQIQRAIKHNQCDWGLIATYSSFDNLIDYLK